MQPSLSDPSLNEILLQEKQLLLSGVTLYLIDLAKAQDGVLRDDIIKHAMHLLDVDRTFAYFMDYEKSSRASIAEARWEVAKLRTKNAEAKEEITELKKLNDGLSQGI